MLCSDFSWIIFIYFIGVVAVYGDAVNSTFDKPQKLSRQCRSYEVEECLLQTWSYRICSFGNDTGPFGYSVGNKAAETRTQFSLDFLKDYYTPETDGDEIYIVQNDTGYISTETIDFDKDAEDFGRYCFIQETIKCFQSKECDILDHNKILNNLYSASKNIAKMLFHIVKHFVKEKYEQAKKFLIKAFN
uniref:Uncharacterized protein n=1 Tax=Panagrolaimus sp. PS1159 TaxID=55785 RepID=A0AC35GMT5_9BILA